MKGHCPTCAADRNAELKGEHVQLFNDGPIWGKTSHRIMVCRGCDTTYFQIEEIFSEDTEWDYDNEGNSIEREVPKFYHYPSPIRRSPPKWAEQFMTDRLLAELGLSEVGSLWELFNDIYGCLNANLPIPAAIAIRTTLDKATEILEIEPSLRFGQKLDALFKLGRISDDERDLLQILVDAGSAAAHRGWKPNANELETLTTLIENFLHRTFGILEAAQRLKGSVPARPKSPPKPKATDQ